MGKVQNLLHEYVLGTQRIYGKVQNLLYEYVSTDHI